MPVSTRAKFKMTALFAVILSIAACGAESVGSDDYIEDSKGKRQLTQVEYDALKKFLAAANQRDAGNTSDRAESHIVVDGKIYLIYWANLCPDGDRSKALHVDGVKFSHDKNHTADLTDVVAWAERAEP